MNDKNVPFGEYLIGDEDITEMLQKKTMRRIWDLAVCAIVCLSFCRRDFSKIVELFGKNSDKKEHF